MFIWTHVVWKVLCFEAPGEVLIVQKIPRKLLSLFQDATEDGPEDARHFPRTLRGTAIAICPRRWEWCMVEQGEWGGIFIFHAGSVWCL